MQKNEQDPIVINGWYPMICSIITYNIPLSSIEWVITYVNHDQSSDFIEKLRVDKDRLTIPNCLETRNKQVLGPEPSAALANSSKAQRRMCFLKKIWCEKLKRLLSLPGFADSMIDGKHRYPGFEKILPAWSPTFWAKSHTGTSEWYDISGRRVASTWINSLQTNV